MSNSPEHAWSPAATVADLRLPPTFVAEHVIRILSYQGALTPVEIARAMHVQDAIALELVEALRSAGVVQLDAGQANFDRLGRIRLSEAGHARVAVARQRTWYAGPLPVSLGDFARRTDDLAPPVPAADAFRSELEALDIEPGVADAIGQSISAAATIAIDGVAIDEQPAVAAALGRSLAGTVTLPYALFAAGAVIRLFDPQHHHPIEDRQRSDGDLDILRSSRDATQWATVARPAVALTGGILASDVVPAYDEDARFYVAPSPLTAIGGLLSVTDAASNPRALIDLARLWLIPGRHHTGIVLLRSGERIEVPWRTATALIGVAPDALPEAARRAIIYAVDIGPLAGEALVRFLARRLDVAAFSARVIDELASRLDGHGLSNRTAAAAACTYLRDRAAYEDDTFAPSDTVLDEALQFARRSCPGPAIGGALRAA